MRIFRFLIYFSYEILFFHENFAPFFMIIISFYHRKEYNDFKPGNKNGRCNLKNFVQCIKVSKNDYFFWNKNFFPIFFSLEYNFCSFFFVNRFNFLREKIVIVTLFFFHFSFFFVQFISSVQCTLYTVRIIFSVASWRAFFWKNRHFTLVVHLEKQEKIV